MYTAVRLGERYGVWGGMSEYELREFRAHLKREGYDLDEPIDADEFRSALAAFYTRWRMEKVYTAELDKLHFA